MIRQKGLALWVQDHAALGLGLAACQKGLSVGFTTAAASAMGLGPMAAIHGGLHEMMEARDERQLLRLQKQMANQKLLIIDELGFVPLSKTGAELLFELISQRYERGATLITSNLPLDEWTEVFGSERLTGALLDRLTHHVNILEMNGDSYRLAQSRTRQPSASPDARSPGWPFRPTRLDTRQLFGERACQGARHLPATVPDPEMADFCAAHWPAFAPPLTPRRSTTSSPRRSARRQAEIRHGASVPLTS